MKNILQRFKEVVAARSRQPAIVRWLTALFLFAVALLARIAVGPMHGANPALTFYPAILLAAVLLGWKEAMLVLGLSVGIGAYLFVSPRMYLLPFSWTLVGSLNIAIITALKTAANELATANERQRILFQEVQHRVANTLQAVAGTLQIAQKRVESAPAEAAKLMEDAAQRFAASADVHRRLNDPTLFRMALGSILQDAIFTALDRNKVKTAFDIEELDLTFDQMSAITMLVIESANNAQKHVFQHGIGSKFLVSLKSLARGRAMLTMSDDGPGLSSPAEGGSAEQKLGFRIICGLVNQLRGTFRVVSGQGTEIIVEFPLDRSLN